jgi:membrane protease YdiL (CAAX protease family)
LSVCVAAIAVAVAHLYQGVRAAITIFQLSVMFGVLFIIGGHNLWSVILCHGLYDTIAFIRFANRSSKYSMPD